MEANILVVEDEKGIRDAITIYLKNRGIMFMKPKTAHRGLKW